MAAINFKREWFTPKDEDGNLSLSTQESRIKEAIEALNPGDWIELEDGSKCTSANEIRNALKDQSMGKANIVTCPLCGALGQAGKSCAFCDATIPEPNNQTKSKVYAVSRIPKQTISPEEFANKISKFQSVESWYDDMAKVSIGELSGVINRNGDFIVPLRYRSLAIDAEGLLIFGERGYNDIYDTENNIIYKGVIDQLSDMEEPDFCYVLSGDSGTGLQVRRGLEGQLIISYRFKNSSGLDDRSAIYDINSKQIIFKGFEVDLLEAYSCYISSHSIGDGGYKIVSKEGLVKTLTEKYLRGFYLHARNTKDNHRMKDKYKVDESLLEISIYKMEPGEFGLPKEPKSRIKVKPPEDLFAAINSAVELYKKENGVVETGTRTVSNKPNVGCMVALLPLLALGTGATFGIIELIKRIFL